MKKTVSMIAIATGFSLMGVAIAQSKDVTETRDVSGFDKIVIENTGVGLDVEAGKDFSVTLEGSKKWVSRVTTDVFRGELVIGRIDTGRKSVNIDSDNRVIVTMPTFAGLEVEGAVDANISGVDSEKLDFEINGAGNIEITGKCRKLDIDMNGAGNFEGRKLKCKEVRVEINGAGNVEAYGSESADLDVNGIGNIDVYGNPRNIEKDKSWFSNITIHSDD